MAKTDGTYESRAEAQPSIEKGPEESARDLRLFWMNQIDAALSEEEKWRKKAKAAWDIYCGDDESAFNILHSNTETIVPAIFNSLPIPDVRTRFNDRNEIARRGAQVLERALAYELDEYDAQEVAEKGVRDFVMTGRGVLRVEYDPTFGTRPRLDSFGQPIMDEAGNPQEQEYLAWEKVKCEYVPYDRFCRGPGTHWEQIEWVAFLKFMNRDELVDLSGEEIGRQIALDATSNDFADNDEGKTSREKSVFRMARVWEVWDKTSRQVLYIAKGYEQGPIAQLDDPLRLSGFFPCPRPLQVLNKPGTMVPIVPYSIYERQAKELNRVSDRILKLTEMAKWRGVRASEIDELDNLETLEDGQFMPSREAMAILQSSGDLSKSIWIMPVGELMAVIKELIAQREVIKSTIFELMGIADIMRGASQASETLGAQRLKAQWGSLKVQIWQNEVQRFWRDLFRIKGEIIAEHFQPNTLYAISGEAMNNDPQAQMMFQQVLGLLKSDISRRYMVDIETDSTIQADRARDRAELSEFMMVSGQFMQQAIGAVQTGLLPPELPVALYQAIAQRFKLGKSIDDQLAKLLEVAGPKVAADQQQQQVEKSQKDQARQLAVTDAQMELQKKQQEIQGQAIENQRAAQGFGAGGPGFVS